MQHNSSKDQLSRPLLLKTDGGADVQENRAPKPRTIPPESTYTPPWPAATATTTAAADTINARLQSTIHQDCHAVQDAPTAPADSNFTKAPGMLLGAVNAHSLTVKPVGSIKDLSIAGPVSNTENMEPHTQKQWRTSIKSAGSINCKDLSIVKCLPTIQCSGAEDVHVQDVGPHTQRHWRTTRALMCVWLASSLSLLATALVSSFNIPFELVLLSLASAVMSVAVVMVCIQGKRVNQGPLTLANTVDLATWCAAAAACIDLLVMAMCTWVRVTPNSTSTSLDTPAGSDVHVSADFVRFLVVACWQHGIASLACSGIACYIVNVPRVGDNTQYVML